MARMHSRKRGKAGSKKPIKTSLPTWIRYKPREVEFLILKLAKEEKSPSQIGLILRDTYGIPDIRLITKKRVTTLLKEKKLTAEVPEDLMALIKKNVKVRKHLEVNKQDKTAKRGLQLTESKIKRLIKYYKKTGRIKSEWKYDPKKASMFIE